MNVTTSRAKPGRSTKIAWSRSSGTIELPAIPPNRGKPVGIGDVAFAHQIYRSAKQLGKLVAQPCGVQETPVGRGIVFNQQVYVATGQSLTTRS